MALAQDDRPDEPVGDLVSRALTLRSVATDGGSPAETLANWLAYDVVLVRLCERLGVEHGMLAHDAGPAARARAEAGVAETIPFFSRALDVG
jgi:hypothetical protein